MRRSRQLILWFLPLLMIIMSCDAHYSGSRRKSRRAADQSEEYGGQEEEDSGDDSGSARVSLEYKRLSDAVIERSTSGVPRNNMNRLRKSLCEGREDEPRIFYQLIVSTHWHYYWICSDFKARRASSSVGAKRLREWMEGFDRQVSTSSVDCSSGSHKALLRGTHESGIRAVGYCDGRIILSFPDGGKGTRYFTSQANGRGTGGSDEEEDETDRGSSSASADGANPDCPAPKTCPACPSPKTCPACPTPKPCPACPPPPPCNCQSQIQAAERKAGETGFKQGVEKVCRSICQVVYNKCRSINPNTALCYQVSEHCANSCGK